MRWDHTGSSVCCVRKKATGHRDVDGRRSLQLKELLNGTFGRLKPISRMGSLPALRARGKTPEASTVQIIRKRNLVDLK